MTTTKKESKTMPKLGEMFESKYLKVADFDDAEPAVLTIKRLKQERLGMGADAEDKWVVYFDELEKGLVLNKTNAKTISVLYGDDTDDWIGEKIAIRAAEIEFKGERMMGLRVSPQKPKPKSKAAKPAPASVAANDGDDDEEDEGDIPF